MVGAIDADRKYVGTPNLCGRGANRSRSCKPAVWVRWTTLCVQKL